MQEAGLFMFWEKSSLPKEKQKTFGDENIKVLTLTELQSIFLLWIIGLSISVTRFFVEMGIYFILPNARFPKIGKSLFAVHSKHKLFY